MTTTSLKGGSTMGAIPIELGDNLDVHQSPHDSGAVDILVGGPGQMILRIDYDEAIEFAAAVIHAAIEGRNRQWDEASGETVEPDILTGTVWAGSPSTATR